MRWVRLRWLLLLVPVVLAAAAGYVYLEKQRLADSFLAQGRSLAEQGRHRTALTDYTLAILLTPGRSEPYLARARAFRALMMNPEAAADLSAAIDRAPADPELRLLRAVVRGDGLKEYRPAIRDLNAVLALQPDNATAYYRRALAYDQINNPHHALQDYTRALELRPDFAEAYLNRAALHGRSRRYAEQAADLTQALRLRPGDTALHDQRGRAYLALQRFAEARRDFDRVLAVQPTALGYFQRGTALLNLRAHRAAVADFTRALERNRFSLAARYNRALAYEALGERRRARTDWAIVCELQASGQSEACLRARRVD